MREGNEGGGIDVTSKEDTHNLKAERVPGHLNIILFDVFVNTEI